MSESTDPQAWVLRAEEDYLLCRSALRRKMPLLYGATFHAQQCAEKYLKALLVARDQVFPRTHDLAALHDLCIQADLRVGVELDQLERLNAYAVQMRYPGDDLIVMNWADYSHAHSIGVKHRPINVCPRSDRLFQ